MLRNRQFIFHSERSGESLSDLTRRKEGEIPRFARNDKGNGPLFSQSVKPALLKSTKIRVILKRKQSTLSSSRRTGPFRRKLVSGPSLSIATPMILGLAILESDASVLRHPGRANEATPVGGVPWKNQWAR